MAFKVYRGISLIRNHHPVGPYRRPMPGLLWWCNGDGGFLQARYPCRVPRSRERESARARERESESAREGGKELSPSAGAGADRPGRRAGGQGAAGDEQPPVRPPPQREFCIDNLLVRIHFSIVVIRWTGLAPWEFELPLPGSLTSTFLATPPPAEKCNDFRK